MAALRQIVKTTQLISGRTPAVRCASTKITTGGKKGANSQTALPEETRIVTDKAISAYKSTILPLSIENVNALTSRAEQNLQHATGIAFRRKLFTPGPLMVSNRVKTAMMADIGKRHADFAYVVKFVRNALLQIAKVDPEVFSTILLNGSGTFATEATLRTLFGGTKKKLVVMENGKYAQRIADLSRSSGLNVKVIPVNLKTLQDTLLSCPNDVAGVIVVHCETSSGKINPANEIGEIVKKCNPECLFLVDAMTSFGAIPIKMKNVDFLMSNSCKSLQGVPGVSFTIARKAMLQKHRCCTPGLVLDIGAQFDELERSGQFRFTPPTHVMLGLKECLLEYSEEGGLRGRAERYKKNTEVLKEEMAKMGFRQLFLDNENPNGYIVTSFIYPNVPQFVFKEFYKRLSDAGHVIASDRSTVTNCFRIGSIGDLYEEDMRSLTNSIRDVCADMRIELPLEDQVF